MVVRVGAGRDFWYKQPSKMGVFHVSKRRASFHSSRARLTLQSPPEDQHDKDGHVLPTALKKQQQLRAPKDQGHGKTRFN